MWLYFVINEPIIGCVHSATCAIQIDDFFVGFKIWYIKPEKEFCAKISTASDGDSLFCCMRSQEHQTVRVSANECCQIFLREEIADDECAQDGDTASANDEVRVSRASDQS